MEYKEKVSYKVDKKNVIVEVSDDWVAAAKVGEANDLIDVNSVLGTKLFSYILGDSTRMYYDVIFQKCRLLKKEHKIAYRCDSSTHKRFMEMQIVPRSSKDLDIYNYLIKDEPFRHPINIYENVPYNRKKPVMRCSICNSLKLSLNSEWVFPEDLVQNEEQDFTVIYSVCPNCRSKN